MKWVIKSTRCNFPIESDESIVSIGGKVVYEDAESAYRALLAIGRSGYIIEELKDE
jgi:hypothetical protein